MLEAGLIVSRFLHYTAVLVLFGASLFPLYAYPNRADQPPARLCHWTHWFLLSATVVALMSSLPWLAFTTANMMGSLSGGTDWDSLRSVLSDTGFGHVWLARAMLSSLIFVGLVTARRNSPGRRPLLALLAALLLVSLADVGHTQQSEGTAGIIHVGSDALHLLAAGAWIGGLIALAYVLLPGAENADQVLMRFSGMGYVAVAVLVASGLVNGWLLVGSADGLVSSPYGQLLLVKLCLFASMLGLAVTNRFWLVPSLVRDGQSAKGNAVSRLRSHVLAEETLGLLIILIVSALGTMEPAAGQISP